jgi:hypothetical protein
MGCNMDTSEEGASARALKDPQVILHVKCDRDHFVSLPEESRIMVDAEKCQWFGAWLSKGVGMCAPHADRKQMQWS